MLYGYPKAARVAPAVYQQAEKPAPSCAYEELQGRGVRSRSIELLDSRISVPSPNLQRTVLSQKQGD
jgi:hypothetical protein